MALERKDRVQDTTTTTGTGTISLGASCDAGFRTFVSAVTGGATVRYLIISADNSEWEVGEGVFTDASPDTLTRATVFASSNSGSKVDFSAGTKKVHLVLTAGDISVKASGAEINTGIDDAKFATAKAIADSNLRRTFSGSGTFGNTIAQNTTTYMGIYYANEAYTTAFVIPFNATIKNLYVYSGGAPGAGQTYTYTMMVNNSAQTVTCQISGAASNSSNDTTHSFTVSAGDRVVVRLVTSATAADSSHIFSFEVDPT